MELSGAVELSILIPARNEIFLRQTIESITENIEADTEVIAVLDGQLPVEGILQHERVNIILLPKSIGQRAATNMACRLSKAEYVMKVDAHCSFDKGFDRKLIEDMQDDWTQVPIMRNLHAFDWVCQDCGNRRYQGPTKKCDKCGGQEEKDIVWRAKRSPNSTSYRFDKNLQFGYWGEYKAKQNGDLVETMSLQGSCFMMKRERYWDLNICDESWGSWGNQGTEVALKSWLSGGRVIVNKKTWYAHMFRTQGGDFGFPYPLSGKEVSKARQCSRDLFLNDNWDKAVKPLSWLIEKFNPPEWDLKQMNMGSS
jgi:glycosyltransferase involved in cell wall biosynthesis